MRVLFANPPVVRSSGSSPANDFRLGGPVLKSPRLARALRCLGVGRDIRCGVRAGSRWPWTKPGPLGGSPHYPFMLGYAAALLRANGFEVSVMDAVAEELYSYPEFLRRARAWGPDIVVMECSAPTLDIDLWLAGKVSVFAEVALAGAHAAADAAALRAACPGARYLLKGEYIYSSLRMARTRAPGVYEPEVAADMDALPFPLRDFAGGHSYFDPNMGLPRPQLQLYAGKGCPYSCSFCLWPRAMYGGRTAYRSPASVASEIGECVSAGGYKGILFDDDTFNAGNERVAALCRTLARVGLPWAMMGRLDCSPPELFDLMADSGCVGMRFGVETFDRVVLERAGKAVGNFDLEGALERLLRRHPRLVVQVNLMKDLPGQTAASHAADLRFVESLGFRHWHRRRGYQAASCAPFPGTRLHEELFPGPGAAALSGPAFYDGNRRTVMGVLAGRGGA